MDIRLSRFSLSGGENIKAARYSMAPNKMFRDNTGVCQKHPLSRPFKGDNELVYVAKAFAEQVQLDDAINEIKLRLGSDVVQLRYTLGQDWSGDSAIFFRIVLSDQASRRDQLRNSTNRLSNLIVDYLQPLERWGVLPYFNFRSQAEQAVLREEAWT